ncbi:hypothetical protein CPC08DRAFT_723561 [Agrocybe pediades]|nr:hypothetical protein CPC08DRAFT_723561 [Agrocybe pediades]
MSWLGGSSFWPLNLSSVLEPLVKYNDSGTASIHLIESEGLWQGLKGGEHCLRYATREYTARLSTIESISREGMMRLCRETPVEIHGKVMHTDFCQDLGFGRGVWGFWSVDFDEPECETRWGEFIDLGCVLGLDSSHSLRIESRLENLQPGSNWQVMCATTPADVHGHHYGGAVECFHSPSSGTHGIWDLPDVSCENVD